MRGCLTTAASIFVLCTAYLGSIVDHTHCAIRPRASMGGTEKVMLQNLLIASIMRLSDLLNDNKRLSNTSHTVFNQMFQQQLGCPLQA